jgi:hypothetical protein
MDRLCPGRPQVVSAKSLSYQLLQRVREKGQEKVRYQRGVRVGDFQDGKYN